MCKNFQITYPKPYIEGGENMANKKKNTDVSEGIKNAAGAMFHEAHDALEAVEDAAMNAVDATSNAVDNLKNDPKSKNNSQ